MFSFNEMKSTPRLENSSSASTKCFVERANRSNRATRTASNRRFLASALILSSCGLRSFAPEKCLHRRTPLRSQNRDDERIHVGQQAEFLGSDRCFLLRHVHIGRLVWLFWSWPRIYGDAWKKQEIPGGFSHPRRSGFRPDRALVSGTDETGYCNRLPPIVADKIQQLMLGAFGLRRLRSAITYGQIRTVLVDGGTTILRTVSMIA